ncbi:unnamed protein product [Pedinophyceae sp. YPF-701]|nr:unnamed protein product [Pedinophyceae sp. YPF-701]
MVQVYKEPLLKRHYASLISNAVAFRALGLVAVLVLAVIASYASGGFWQRLMMTHNQPRVKFTYDMVVVLHDGTRTSAWTPYATMNEALGSAFVPASVDALERDINNDGKPDVLDIVFRSRAAPAVQGVTAALQLDYFLDAGVDITMKSLVYVEYFAGLPGAALHVDGDLMLHAKEPLRDRTVRTVYDEDILADPGSGTGALKPGGEINLPDLVAAYLDRNETTALGNVHTVWQASGGASAAGFELRVKVRVPEQVVVAKTARAQLLKWGWVQLFPVLGVFYAVFYLLEAELFLKRVFATRVVSDVERKKPF